MEEKDKKELTPSEKKEQKKYQLIVAGIGLSVATFFTLLALLIHHL